METGFDSRTQRLGDPVICTQLYFCGGPCDEQIERIMKRGFSKEGTLAFLTASCLFFLSFFFLALCLVRRNRVTGIFFSFSVFSIMHFALPFRFHTWSVWKRTLFFDASVSSGRVFSGKYILLRCFGVYYRCIFLRELCCILTSPHGKTTYKQRVKIYSDTTHQNT